MTKEELYSHVQADTEQYCFVHEALDRFFESNVVIPIGSILQYKTSNGKYIDVFNESTGDVSRYRIKPSEPVYEWQWLYINEDNTATVLDFATEDEIHTFSTCVTPIEQTKRVQ